MTCSIGPCWAPIVVGLGRAHRRRSTAWHRGGHSLRPTGPSPPHAPPGPRRRARYPHQPASLVMVWRRVDRGPVRHRSGPLWHHRRTTCTHKLWHFASDPACTLKTLAHDRWVLGLGDLPTRPRDTHSPVLRKTDYADEQSQPRQHDHLSP